jgi:single-stranded-DNA-specific exonuclease
VIGTASIRQRPQPAADIPLGDELHPVLRRVLLARGVRSPAELRLGLGELLAPDSLAGIGQAASLLAEAVQEQRSILVVGDFDADGATGTAVALLALRAMGADRVAFRVPNRFEFGYGLTPGLVETLAASPPDLLLTVDSGIGCVRGIARARELGCRVIVTDHHLPGESLPAADAIVNPNCAGDTFPSKALAGVGVVFYLAGKTRQLLRERGWFGRSRPEPNLAALLDLVALGTVADLVPLDHNNRVLVRQGLERIRRGRSRPGLMALLRAGNRDYRHASAADLGFAVAPRLNAAGRLEDMSVGIRCLLSEDRGEADRLAEQLDALNRQRRDLQLQMQSEAMEQVRALVGALQAEARLPAAVCLFDESWHQGVVGLVAAKIKDAVHRPVVAFAPEAEGSELLKGSARSLRGLHIRDVLALLDTRRPGLVRAFGGHAMAAGLTLPRAGLPAFREALEAAVLSILDGESLDADILTDGGLAAADIGLELARLLQEAGPWGQRFPEPLFDGRFAILDHRVVGGAHLKLRVRAEDGGEALEAIAFNHGSEDLPGSATVRLLYRLDINRWQGSETCQLRVEQIVRE